MEMDPRIAATGRKQDAISRDNMDGAQRTITMRLHVSWNTASSAQLYATYKIEWREEHAKAKTVPQAIWRDAVLRVKEQVERWEAAKENHAPALLRTVEQGKKIPRRVQRRPPDPNKLYRPNHEPHRLRPRFHHRRARRAPCGRLGKIRIPR